MSAELRSRRHGVALDGRRSTSATFLSYIQQVVGPGHVDANVFTSLREQIRLFTKDRDLPWSVSSMYAVREEHTNFTGCSCQVLLSWAYVHGERTGKR